MLTFLMMVPAFAAALPYPDVSILLTAPFAIISLGRMITRWSSWPADRCKHCGLDLSPSAVDWALENGVAEISWRPSRTALLQPPWTTMASRVGWAGPIPGWTRAILDEPPEETIRRELATSERLLWCGRPRRGLIRLRSDAYMIPLGVLWGVFAIAWVWLIFGRAPMFFRIWAGGIVAVGWSYFLVGRYWVDAWQRAAITYAVTSERVMVVSGMLTRTVRSMGLDSLSGLSLDEDDQGAGVIHFGPIPAFCAWAAEVSMPGIGRHLVPHFELPEGAREVYEIILAARREAGYHG